MVEATSHRSRRKRLFISFCPHIKRNSVLLAWPYNDSRRLSNRIGNAEGGLKPLRTGDPKKLSQRSPGSQYNVRRDRQRVNPQPRTTRQSHVVEEYTPVI